MLPYSADEVYGRDPTATLQQPTASPVPTHAGQPEQTMQTRPGPAMHHSPAFAIVALIAVAIVLSQFTFSGTVKVSG